MVTEWGEGVVTIIKTPDIPDITLKLYPILSPFYRLRKLRFREVK